MTPALTPAQESVAHLIESSSSASRVPAKALAEAAGLEWSENARRFVADTVKVLRDEHGWPVNASKARGRSGYYLARTESEIAEYMRELSAQIHSMLRTRRRIRRSLWRREGEARVREWLVGAGEGAGVRA